MFDTHSLAPTGTTGSQSHAGVHIDDGFETIAFEFIVEAAGATPTVTWKIQGSLADPEVADGSATWFDIGYVTDSTDSIATATRTATAVGTSVNFLSNPVARRYRRYRLVTSANTNITYSSRMHRITAE